MSDVIQTYRQSVPAWWLLPNAIWWAHPKWRHWEVHMDGWVFYQVEQQ